MEELIRERDELRKELDALKCEVASLKQQLHDISYHPLTRNNGVVNVCTSCGNLFTGRMLDHVCKSSQH